MTRILCITKEQLRAVLTASNWSVFSFDTETYDVNKGVGAQTTGMTSWWNQKPHIVTFTNNEYSVLVDLTKDWSMTEELQTLFNKAVFIIAHNITYDAKALKKIDVDCFSAEWYDTMVAEHLLHEEKRLGLKELAREYFAAETISYKEAIKHGPSSEEFYNYAWFDSELTMRLFNIQKERLKEQGLTTLMRELEGPFLKVIAEMEMNGFAVDRERVEETLRRIEEDLPELELKALVALQVPHEFQASLFGDMKVVTDFNINSSHQLSNKLLSFGVPLKDKTPTGKYKIDGPALTKVKDKHQAIPLLLQYKKVHKLHSAFFKPLLKQIDPDGRVRPYFNNTGTVTGRLSCSGPNLQQLSGKKKDPYGLRSCFVAPTGKKLVVIDYAGQELRILAHISRDNNMVEAFRQGKDLHLAMANQFFKLGIPEEEMISKNPVSKKHAEKYKAERDKAKIINFGIAYGKGPQGFAADFNLPLEEAEGILNLYFKAAPKVKEAIENTKSLVQRQGYVASITGRRRRFQKINKEYYPNSAYRQAFNFLIQGFASDMLRMASIKTRKLSQQYPEWDLRVVATVHDENVYEVKEEYCGEAATEIKRCFENILEGFLVPIVAEVKIGDSYEAK